MNESSLAQSGHLTSILLPVDIVLVDLQSRKSIKRRHLMFLLSPVSAQVTSSRPGWPLGLTSRIFTSVGLFPRLVSSGPPVLVAYPSRSSSLCQLTWCRDMITTRAVIVVPFCHKTNQSLQWCTQEEDKFNFIQVACLSRLVSRAPITRSPQTPVIIN